MTHVAKIVGYILALIAVQGLAIVQSVSYLEDFVSYSNIPGVFFLTALLVGVALGWTVRDMRLLALSPAIVILGGTLVFCVVAYSPVLLSENRYNVPVINELTRQSVLMMILSIIPAYLGAFGGMFLAEQQR